MRALRTWVQMLQPAALFAPIVIVGLMLEFGVGQLTSPYNAQGGDLPQKSLSHVAAVAVAFAFLAVIYLSLRARLREAVLRIVLLACLPVGGLLGGLFLGWSRQVFGLDRQSLLPVWTAVTFMHVTALGALLCLASSGIRLHYQRLDSLARDRDRLQDLELQTRQSLTEIDVQRTEAVRSRILDGLTPAEAGDPQRSLPAMTATLEDIVRPLSRQLESQSERWMPPPPRQARPEHIGWKAAAIDGMDPRLLNPFWTVVILNLLAGPMNIARAGMGMTVAFILVSFVFAWPMFALLRRGAVRIVGGTSGAWCITVFVTLCIVCGLVLAAGLLPFTLDGPLPYRFFYLTPMYTLLVAFFWGFAVAAQRQAKATEADLREATVDLQWHIARSRELHRQRRRALAHAVHGQVQAALAAGILEITAAVSAGTVTDDQVRDVRRRIIECIQELDLRQMAPSPLNVLLLKVEATWAGLATLTLDVDPDLVASLTADPQCLMTLNDLIPELVFNSVKHGRATYIRIRITLVDQRTVRLEVSDNGLSLTEDASSGMGSRLLDQASISWDRRRTGESTVTTALLPLAPSAMTDQFSTRYEGVSAGVSP